MKVLLVKPYNLSDHIQPSLGLGYLAASIRHKHEVKILDCLKEKLKIKSFGEFIKGYKPDVVGLQCYTFDLKFIKEALSIIKGINKNIITVVGGPHPSAMPQETMEKFKGNLDFIFTGEAEIGLPKLLDLLKSGKKDYSTVEGLSWLENGHLRSNPRAVTEDLNALEMPAWDLIHPEDYPESQHGAFFRNFPIAPIMITRGCPFPCTFCAGKVISGKAIRRRSIENVLKELNHLYHKHGIREIHVIDDNFTMDMPYAKELLRRLKKLDLKISWAVPNGVRMDALDEELLGLMKETGLYLISLGIESGSDEVLGRMKKCITTKRIKEKVEMIRKAGIDMAGFFILGYPGETVKTIKETIKFAKTLPLVRANFFTYLPFPGSESYAALKESNELYGVDWDNFYFMNAAYVPKGLTRKKLRRLHRQAFARFYLRPRILFYNIKSIQSFRHFQFLFKRFYNWIIGN